VRWRCLLCRPIKVAAAYDRKQAMNQLEAHYAQEHKGKP
jgi:hypothetical protein